MSNAFEASGRRGRKPRFDISVVRELREQRKTNAEIRSALGCSMGTVVRLVRQAGLAGERRAANKPRKVRDQYSSSLKRPVFIPSLENESIAAGRTIYPGMVVSAVGTQNVLVSGANSWKIGKEITKGRWKGFPVFTLTLEERATCPTSCQNWRSCYGNSMNFARRVKPGPELDRRLEVELSLLQMRHPGGFAVRLHVLGDFHSVEYVRAWRGFLDRFPALHVFGFSARWDRADPIALELIQLVIERWDRFAIRFSDAPVDECSTVTLEHPVQKPRDVILCPQQIGKTLNCSTCALCWQSKRRVGFLKH